MNNLETVRVEGQFADVLVRAIDGRYEVKVANYNTYADGDFSREELEELYDMLGKVLGK